MKIYFRLLFLSLRKQLLTKFVGFFINKEKLFYYQGKFKFRLYSIEYTKPRTLNNNTLYYYDLKVDLD